MKKSLLVNIVAAGLLIPMGVILSSDDTAQQLNSVVALDNKLEFLKQNITQVAQAENDFLSRVEKFTEAYSDFAIALRDIATSDNLQAGIAELGLERLAKAYRYLDETMQSKDNGAMASFNEKFQSECLKTLLLAIRAVTKNFSPENAQVVMRKLVFNAVTDEKILLLALINTPENFLIQYISVFENSIQHNLSQLPKDLAQKLQNKIEKAKQSNVVV